MTRNRTPHRNPNFRKLILAVGSKSGSGQANAAEEPKKVIIIIVKVIRDEELLELELCQWDGAEGHEFERGSASMNSFAISK